MPILNPMIIKRFSSFWQISVLIATQTLLIFSSGAAELVLKKGDRLAIVGDSITEQKQYSRFIENYLLACTPELELKIFQFGWSGERAPGFAHRMDNDLIPWKPTVVTTAFGMNDGSYRAYNEAIGRNYEQGTRRIQDRMKEIGARMVVGGPGPVDLDSWRRDRPDEDKVYNDNLGKLSAIAGRLAKERGFVFGNLHPMMMKVMADAKAANGAGYHVCGGDGVHPAANGHLIMAYSFLKGLGVDGNIGTITVDMKAKASASEGHRVIASDPGMVEVESSRYPFCFSGAEKDPNGTRSILPFLPFNEDLNRFMLVVKNLESEQAEVTWGEAKKIFPRAQLEQGINLAAEFIDNPFVEPFQRLDRIVQQKQQYETNMIKRIVTNFRQIRNVVGKDDELDELLAGVYGKLGIKQEKYQEQARDSVQPLRHKLSVAAK